MDFQYDPDADCVYILINKLPHSHSKELDEARFIDYAKDNTIIGIELLYVGAGVDVHDLPYRSEITQLLQRHKIKVVE